MNPLIIKIVVSILGIVLKTIGEKWWHNAQRFILPVFYSAGVSYVSNCWWLGFTTLPMIGPLCMGYKDYGSIDFVVRGLWMLVICLVAGLGPSISNHLSWFLYVPWVILAGVIGATLRNIDNWIEAPVCGLWIVLMIWFIHP